MIIFIRRRLDQVVFAHLNDTALLFNGKTSSATTGWGGIAATVTLSFTALHVPQNTHFNNIPERTFASGLSLVISVTITHILFPNIRICSKVGFTAVNKLLVCSGKSLDLRECPHRKRVLTLRPLSRWCAGMYQHCPDGSLHRAIHLISTSILPLSVACGDADFNAIRFESLSSPDVLFPTIENNLLHSAIHLTFDPGHM